MSDFVKSMELEKLAASKSTINQHAGYNLHLLNGNVVGICSNLQFYTFKSTVFT